MIENNKVRHLEDIINRYDEFLRLENQEESIKVISAHTLDKKQKKALQDSLSKKYGHSNFNVEFEVQSELKGGL